MIQDQVKKLKLNVTNIKSFLIKKNSESRRIRIQKNSELDRSEKLQKIKEKEKKIEAPKTGIGASLKRITSTLFSGPMSLFDKIMNFLGYILLGLIVNELPKIITSIRDFFDKNKWIIKGLKFFIDAIGTSIMGVAKLVSFLSDARQKQIKDQREIIDKSINDLSSTFNQQESSLSNILANLNKPQKASPPKATPPPARPMSQQPFAPGGRPAVRPVPYGPGGSSTGSGRGQFNFRRPQPPQKFAKGGEVKRSPSSNTGSSNRNTFTRGETGRQKAARQSINYFSVFKDSVSKLLSTSKIEKNNNKKFKDLFELIKSMPSLFETDKNRRSPNRNPPGSNPNAIFDPPIAVRPDEVIGTLGSTGRSTGPHIHIENNTTRGGRIPVEVKNNILVGGRPLMDLYGPEDGNDGIGNYAWRISARNPLGFHAGEDYAGTRGAQITLRGGLKFVKFIPDDGGGYGNRVIIQSSDGIQYSLNHLDSGPVNLAALRRRQDEQLSANVPGGNNAEKVWNFFKSKGLSDIAVAGIMGNAQQESGFRPTAKNGDPNNPNFVGIFQWDNNRSGDRWGNLRRWAQSKRLDPFKLETQLQFSWHELTNSESASLELLKKARSPEQAAQIWYDEYERASHGLDKRMAYAKGFYQRYKGRTPGQPAPQSRPRPATPAATPSLPQTIQGLGQSLFDSLLMPNPTRGQDQSQLIPNPRSTDLNGSVLNTSGSGATFFLLSQTVETYVPVPMAYPVLVKSSSGSYSPSSLSDIWNA